MSNGFNKKYIIVRPHNKNEQEELQYGFVTVPARLETTTFGYKQSIKINKMKFTKGLVENLLVRITIKNAQFLIEKRERLL